MNSQIMNIPKYVSSFPVMLQQKHNITAVIIQTHRQNAPAGFDIFTPDTGVLKCVLKSHFNFFHW